MTSPRTRNSRCRRLPENSERGCLQAAEAITFGGSAEMPRLLDMGCALYEPRVDGTVSPKVVRLFCFCCCQEVCHFGVRLFHPNVSFTDSEVLKAATGTGVQRRAVTVAAATIRLTKRTNSAATMTKPPTAIPAGSDRPRLEPGTPPLCRPLTQCANHALLSVPIAAAEEEEDPRCGLLKSHTKDHTAVSVPASTSGDLMLEEPVSDVSYAQPHPGPELEPQPHPAPNPDPNLEPEPGPNRDPTPTPKPNSEPGPGPITLKLTLSLNLKLTLGLTLTSR